MASQWTPKTPEDKARFSEKFILLKHMLRNLNFYNAASKIVSKMKLFDDFEDLTYIWNNTHEYADEYDKLPVRNILDYALSTAVNFNYSAEEAVVLSKRLMKMLDNIFVGENDQLDYTFASDLLKKYVSGFAYTSLKQGVESGESIDSLIENTSKILDDRYVTILEDKNPFRSMDINKHLAQTARIPLGIDFIDSALDGGTLPGEVVGFIIPTGGGKSTLAWQGIAECVAREEHSVIVSFEQGIDGDFTLRACVLATDSTRADWAEADFNKVDPDIKERFEKSKAAWAKYMHFYDTWLDPNNKLHSVDQMFDNIMESLADQGAVPSVLFIDWWGNMESKLRESNSSRSDSDSRGLTDKWLHRIKICSQKYNLRTFVFHQKSGAAAGKSSSYVGSAHDAKDNKSFPVMLDFCFVSSQKDTENNVIFRLDKSRATANSQIKAYLDAERCRFTHASPDYGACVMSEIEAVTVAPVADALAGNFPSRREEDE